MHGLTHQLNQRLQPFDFDWPTIPVESINQENVLLALWQAQCAWVARVGISANGFENATEPEPTKE
jgi:hypothetical protein